MKQLSIFGITPDQNTYQSEKWGLLTFYPTRGHKWTDTCRHCLLWESVLSETSDCANAPCQAQERADGKNGYFSIHNYPNKKDYGNN